MDGAAKKRPAEKDRGETGNKPNRSPPGYDWLYPQGPGPPRGYHAGEETGEGPAKQSIHFRTISDDRYAHSQARSLFTLPLGLGCGCWFDDFRGWGGSRGFGGTGALGGFAGWAGRAGW
jgi:hypothetical protein